MRVVVSGPEPGGPATVLAQLRGRLREVAAETDILGPAPLVRLRGRHRAQLLVKADAPRPVASLTARLLAGAAPAMRRDGLAASVDVDPQGVL